MKQILQSFKTGEMWLAEVPAPLCKAKGAVVKVERSFVSAGTEKMLAEFAKKGMLGKAMQMPDQVKKVIRKMKTEGIWATLEKVQAKLDQPIPLGYSCAGTIVEAGRDCGNFKVGDRVACGGAGFANHAEYDYVPKNLMVKIPEGVSFEEASAATVGAIALQGVRQCEVKLGESVAVIGLGLMGILAVQMLKASGCRVIGFDPNAGRCRLAKDLGCDEAVATDLTAAAMAFSDGYGVDAVLITAATHSDEPVTTAAEICRKKGKVVATGLVGMNLPRDQYYKKEIDFRLSCSYGPGRYDPGYEEQGVDYPFGYVRWTENRNIAAFLQLVKEGKVTPAKLTTHRFKFDEALNAYEMMLKRTEPYLGIVLEYEGAGQVARRVELGERECESKCKCECEGGVREEVGVGFLGCGNFAKAVLLPTVKKQAGARLTGICTASGMNCGETGKKEGFKFATTDEKELFGDAATQLVMVTTRHDLHARQIMAALAAGKRVFCEKPLCVKEAELEELDKAGRGKVMVGFNRRFSPHAKLLREYFAGRKLPLVMHYRVNAGSIPKDVWLQDPEIGGGRIVGEGCHFIDFMAYVCGAKVKKVQAMCIQMESATETPEDSVCINLQFEDGSVGVLEYVALGDTTLPKEWCEIHGEGSTATMDNFCTTVCSGRLGKRKLKGKQRKGFAEEVAATLESVKQGTEMPIPWGEILNATRATFAARKALKSGLMEDVA